MTIEISDEDVIKSLAAYRESESWNPHWGSSVGMRAALESFVARHPELPPQRAMHEPVTEEEAERAYKQYHETYRVHRASMLDFQNVLADFLARRAAPKPEPVVVTEEMRRQCMKDIGWESSGAGRAVWEAMKWMADRLNGKHEELVDPRVEIVRDWAQSHSLEPYDEAIARLLVKLDEVNP